MKKFYIFEPLEMEMEGVGEKFAKGFVSDETLFNLETRIIRLFEKNNMKYKSSIIVPVQI